MRTRRPFVRLAVRKMVRQDKITRKVGNQFLRDSDMSDALAAMVEEAIEEDKEFTAGEDGPLISLFKWIIEHQEEVIKFITLIISLFMDEETA